MGRMDKHELVKIYCTAVVAHRDGDRIVGEETSQPTACYSLEDCQSFFTSAVEGVKAMNEAERTSKKK